MKRRLVLAIVIGTYILLFSVMISLIVYTKSYSFFKLFFISLVFNIVIVFICKCRLSIKKILLLNLLFCVMISLPQILNVVTKNEILDWCKTIAFYLIKYIITGNWLVPFIVGFFANAHSNGNDVTVNNDFRDFASGEEIQQESKK